MRYMVLAVPMSEWSWLEDILDPDTGLPTGRKERKYGIFWEWVNNSFDPSVVTGEFTRLISETPKIMIKDGAEWGVEIIAVSRFNVPDYDAWATGLLTDAIMVGVTILATTTDDKGGIQVFYADNGLTNPGET